MAGQVHCTVDGTMRVQGDLQESDCIDLPKASVDRLSRIFREIQNEATTNDSLY